MPRSPQAPKEKEVVKRKVGVVICPDCGVIFVDIIQDPFTCPVCGKEFYFNDEVELDG